MRFQNPYERTHDVVENKGRRFFLATMLLKTGELTFFATMLMKKHALAARPEFETNYLEAICNLGSGPAFGLIIQIIGRAR